MSKGLYGGGGIRDCYRVAADHSGIKQLGTLSAPGSAATTLAHKSIRFGDNTADSNELIETSSTKFDDQGVPTFSISKSDIPTTALIAFEAVACPKTVKATGGASTRNEKTAENGRKINTAGVSSDTVPFLMIEYGAESEDGVLVRWYLVGFKKTSFGSDTKGTGDLNMTNVDAIGIAPSADIDIPKELFDSTMVTVAADQTLPKGSYREQAFFPAAA